MPFKKGHTINVGRKHSQEYKDKLSVSLKGKPAWNRGKKGVYSDETIKKFREAAKGRKFSKSTLQKMSAAKKGRKFPAMSRAKKGIKLSTEHRLKVIKTLAIGLNEKHPLWKGDNVGYTGLHQWVRRKLGTPSRCEFCFTEEKRRYQWANISRKYKRDLNDWIRLCPSCHKKWDIEHQG